MVCSGSLCGTTSHRDGEASALNQQLHSCTRVHAVEGPDKTCMARLFVRPLILGSASPHSLAMTIRTSPERLLPYLGEALHEWWRWQAGSFSQEPSRMWRYMLMWPASKGMYTVLYTQAGEGRWSKNVREPERERGRAAYLINAAKGVGETCSSGFCQKSDFLGCVGFFFCPGFQLEVAGRHLNITDNLHCLM